jgi:hypothetical protein
MEQRTLAAARSSDDSSKLTLGQFEIHTFEDLNLSLTHPIGFMKVLRL